MAWPLTGSALTKYNRLLSDLRQYGDFIFVGAPDDITWLQETIVAASDGQLRPPLDDVANRSHYWMLRTIALLGNQTIMPKPEPCPECPPVIPCPPCPPSGLIWGPDSTTLDISFNNLDFNSILLGDSAAPKVTSIIWNGLETVDDFGAARNIWLNFSQLWLESVSFPDLTAVLSTASIFGDFLQSLNSFSAPKLVSVGGSVVLNDCVLLTVVDLSSIVTITGGVSLSRNPVLASVNFPVFVPTNGSNLSFSDNALDAASINHILARAVANAGYVSGTVTLSGGTNAAPTGQGITDKATLIARGVTVTTN